MAISAVGTSYSTATKSVAYGSSVPSISGLSIGSVTSGNTIIVIIASDNALAYQDGSTYGATLLRDSYSDLVRLTKDAEAINSGNVVVSIWSGVATWSGASSLRVTNTYAGNNNIAFVVQQFSGVTTTSAFDKSSTGTGSDASPTSGATATLSQADEVCIGGVGTEGPVDDTNGTWGDSFTDLGEAGTTGSNANSNTTCSASYKVVSATTAKTASKTGITSRDWAAVIATYKAAAGNTYNETATMGLSQGQSTSYTYQLGAAISLGLQNSLAQSNNAILGASTSMGISAGQSDGAIGQFNKALDMGTTYGISASGGSVFAGAVALGLLSSIAAAAVPIYNRSISLGISNALQTVATQIIPGLITLGINESLAAAAKNDSQAALTLAITNAISSSYSLAAQTFDESISLQLQAIIAAAARVAFNPSATFSIQESLSPSAIGTFTNAVSLALSESIIPTALKTTAGSVTLALRNALTDSAAGVFNRSVSMAIQEALTSTNSAAVNPLVSLALLNSMDASPQLQALVALIFGLNVGYDPSTGGTITEEIILAMSSGLSGMGIITFANLITGIYTAALSNLSYLALIIPQVYRCDTLEESYTARII